MSALRAVLAASLVASGLTACVVEDRDHGYGHGYGPAYGPAYGAPAYGAPAYGGERHGDGDRDDFRGDRDDVHRDWR